MNPSPMPTSTVAVTTGKYGYRRHRDTVERYTPYFPVVTAAVLVGMGLGFITGVL